MTTERKNISLTLSVPPDTRKKLRQLAVDREQSLSEIVIELIDNTAATVAPNQAIKITFSAEEWLIMAQALIQKDIKDNDPGAVADYCKKSILEAVQKVLDNANKN